MTVLIIIAALLIAGFLGWPVTALVLKLARSVDNKTEIAGETVGELPSDSEAASAQPSTSAESVASSTANEAAESSARSSAAAVSELASAKVLRGGLLIGILERLAVVLCLVFDQPVAIAYVIAVKGLGRYPELKESPAASERFIIGTLTSMIFATLLGVLARWLIGLL